MASDRVKELAKEYHAIEAANNQIQAREGALGSALRGLSDEEFRQYVSETGDEAAHIVRKDDDTIDVRAPLAKAIGRKARKPRSRGDRWRQGVSDAQEAFSKLQDAVVELKSLQEEYEQWKDNLPENLQQSALGEKLEAVCDLDFESPLEQVEEVIGEAESIELPQGFGRD